MPTILVVDDDRSVLEMISEALRSFASTIITAETGSDAIAAIKKSAPDVLLLDIKLPDASGLEMVEQVRKIDPRILIIFITVSDSSDITIEAIQKGAFDFLTKPLDFETVQDVVERALETRKMQIPVIVEQVEPDDDDARDVMIGRSLSMLGVYKEIGRVASKNVTVLVCGESGTGKELVARAIYQHSDRSHKPFLAVNCAALTETLLESELFGHEKGAFTGAEQKRIGKFEQCSGGTIFLDEVGDMSPVLQSKVLRLLQEQTFERVGGRDTIETDVRIISATNRDLTKMIEEDDFRLDLYHRLNNFRIDLPPLRERQGDIKLLIQYFLKRLAGQLEIENQGIAPKAMELLTAFGWPGNIRQLQSVLRRALLESTAPVLVPSDFPDEIINPESQTANRADSNVDGRVPSDLRPFIDECRREETNDLYQETQEFMERYLFTRVLKENGGNQSKSAEELGISRGRLRNKLRALGISIEQIVEM